jgi:subtilisin-like proprotein convertase family protein
MQGSTAAETRRGLLLTFAVLGLIAALIYIPYQFRSEAGGQKQQTKKGLFERTTVYEEGLEEIYDIREDKTEKAQDALVGFRQNNGKSAALVADLRDDFVRGEQALKQTIPSARVEYNRDIRTPEVIAPDVFSSNIARLTGTSEQKRSEILRNFLKDYNQLVGMRNEQIDTLKVSADYANPDGNMSFAHLEQSINGVPVFRGEVKAGFTKRGEMIRVINNLAPGLDYASVSTEFGDPVKAVKTAAAQVNYELKATDTALNQAASTDLKVKFGAGGDWDIQAEKIYFPTEPGVAVPAWLVLIWKPVSAYYVIVDAQTGTMLWRKNIAADQTQAATYNVYANSNAFIPVYDSPNPFTPGPINPAAAVLQGARVNRTTVTRIGNEAPYTFNNNGWITDGGNTTDGNAVEAGVDRDTVNGVDPAGIPVGNPNRTFNFPFNPGNPVDNTGDAPTPNQPNLCASTPPPYTDYQRAVATQMFWVMNWYHDELYRLGFTEQARNFQASNFGRGGAENDRISAEGQDCSGVNNANFATPSDGGRGRMQMFIFPGPNPDFDGTIDADVIIHEVTHGTSHRLIGNGFGLGNQGGMMGEGWSDFYAHAMLSEPTDPINGVYSSGGYVTYQLGGIGTANNYYGIRRFPKAVMAFTGGPNNFPHNPLTFGNLNSGNCGSFNSAFPPAFISASCSQVHNGGEIWSSALWEVRAKFIQRLGWEAGNRRVLQVVTDGMKLTPLNPTFLQARDAIISAAAALSAAPEASADVLDVREGFRIRGMGFSASVQSAGAVTEAFDFPNVTIISPMSVSDSTGDNDGYPEPGENVLITVPIINNITGGTINNVSGSVTGGGTTSYGNIADNTTVARQIPYTIPANVACGSLHTITVTGTSAVGALSPRNFTFRVGAPTTAPATFVNNTPINLPNGQPATTSGPASPYPSTIQVSGLSGNKTIKVEITGISHSFPGDLDFLLVGPGGQKYIMLSDSGGGTPVSNLTFALSDGAPTAPSEASWTTGEFKPFNAGANDTFVSPAPAGPYANAAPAGTDTFASVFGIAGSNLNGNWSLYVMDDAGGDTGTMAGWKITFESSDFECRVARDVRADYDGDGRTDASVFRPADGNWYLLRSLAGFTAAQFGTAGDILTPGDFDGDNKADIAVFRPSTGAWYRLNSSDGSFTGIQFGAAGDVPVPGDYDGDNKDDVAVYRPADGTWYRLNSSNGGFSAVQFGAANDVPTNGDFDGDGKRDIAVYRPADGTWYRLNSSDGSFAAVQFGISTDTAVAADYDGDNKTDIAVFRASTGTWYRLNSTNGQFVATQFGAANDVPVPGDYDGDGRTDEAVYRNGIWYVNRTTQGFTGFGFGLATDIPVPYEYLQ